MKDVYLIPVVIFCYAAIAITFLAANTYAARQPIDVHKYVQEYLAAANLEKTARVTAQSE